MKTITCREMGGPCDTPLSANSYKEMINAGMSHLMKAHPKMAEDMNKMSKDDPTMIEWEKDFKRTWAETPDM
ncbi:MAG: hypothetical protein NTZ87_00820 [Candidatus Nomurabacteria bacterium]|nr:hypothetical protein [Candidatus Nomurabacteria bacterium]